MPQRFLLIELERALTLLAERLRLAGLPSQELIVCGGTSLIARGFVSRVTRDVDVLAHRTSGSEFVSARLLPVEFYTEARRVAVDLGLPENWINSAPVALFEMGMPQGFFERLEARTYSDLKIWYIGRLDQIHLKLYAAADDHGGGSRHLNDLIALQPTPEELLMAARWTMTHDVSQPFKELLKAVLTDMQHDDLAAEL